ncbi:hypothetical protein ACHAXH_006715 [Discostella pseudostelligera]
MRAILQSASRIAARTSSSRVVGGGSSSSGVISHRLVAHRAAAALSATNAATNPAVGTRFKSSLPLPEDDDIAPHPSSSSTATSSPATQHDFEPHLDNNTSDTIKDYTSNTSKAGTPSPWAVFDAWGAGDAIADPLSKEEEAVLSPEMVRIPTSEHDRSAENLPDESRILECYDRLLKRKSSVHFGYPYNLMYNHEELYEFMKYSINNLGDPFVPSNYGVHSRQFECAVIDFFADLWKMEKDSYWGYVTTCGTEGNLHGILLARECHPDGILYSSRETHYSVFKAARYYRMDAKAIPTLPMGEIDYDALASEIAKNRDRPVIINVNIGTTVKGAVDNLDRILRILKTLGIPRERFHIHCDGALFAMMMPFVDWAPEVSFQKPIDSIAVSGHKMLGCPMPCGIALTRKEHVKKVEQKIDYLNSVDTTIMGSRNGQAALYLWYSLRKKGIAGIKRDVVHCMETAQYLRDKITEAGLTCRLNDLSSTVVLERPMDDKFIKRWQLACEEDIAHVVVMPNVTKVKIDKFVEELVECKEKHGRWTPARNDSPLVKLQSSSWGGSYVAPSVGNFKESF